MGSLIALTLLSMMSFVLYRRNRFAYSTIAAQERQTQAILHNTVDGILTIDMRGTLQTTNRAGETIFGYVAEEIIGHNVKMLMPEPFRGEHDNYLKNYKSTGDGRTIGISREVVGRRKDGSTFPMELAVSEISHGGERRFIGIVRDISHRKREEEQLELHRQYLEKMVEERTAKLTQAMQAAQAANEAKSQFLASMSHELRTPLNAVLGFSQLMGTDTELPEENRALAEEIERAGRRLLALVEDVLDLSRIDSGNLEISPQPIAVNAVLPECFNMLRAKAQEAGVELIEDGGEAGEATINVDPLRLRQAINNLMSNAIKYNRSGGQVRLKCSFSGEVVRIAVSDTGTGISADKQERLFTSFDRLGIEAGTIAGTGIGLVVTKRIVEAMGGTLGFESVVGNGSTFWMEFPLSRDV
jgi:PAS domain S-box-containing protein